MEIKSGELKKFIYLNLEKDLKEEITGEDLNKITFLNLNYKNFKEEINEYDFNDLKYFKNLKELALNGFEITEEMMESINSISDLEDLVINHSSFKTNEQFVNNIKSLTLTYSEIDNLNNFKLEDTLENIQFISCENVDIKNLVKFKKLKKVSIHNSKILNTIELKNFDALEVLNLDGSSLDYDNLKDVLRTDIKFSHADKFLYTK